MLPPGFENKIMHSSFTVNSMRLMASDGCDDKSTLHGFQLALNVETEEEAHKVFNAIERSTQRTELSLSQRQEIKRSVKHAMPNKSLNKNLQIGGNGCRPCFRLEQRGR
jgi:3-demethylubiquinone-9 3-methyltransferase